MGTVWPPIAYEAQTWSSDGARGPRPDRMFHEYSSAVPPQIAALPLTLDSIAATACEAATASMARLDAEGARELSGFTGALLRSESVASSKIEHLETTSTALGVAQLQAKRRDAPGQVARNVDAMLRALQVAESYAPFSVNDVLSIHLVLMRNDPHDGDSAGRVRTEQNWIGGSDLTPRDALFVPPSPTRVAALLADLADFADRDDIPAFPQALIVHAQFETIHPFNDGNGRTGRALIHAILRRRRLVRHVAVPLSAALLTDTSAYFDALDAYRRGDLDTYLIHAARATDRAAIAAHDLGNELAAIRLRWEETVRPRRGSTSAALLELVRVKPVIDIATIASALPVDDSNLYRALDHLVNVGVLHEITGDRRNRIWAAPELLDAVDSFNARLARRRTIPAV